MAHQFKAVLLYGENQIDALPAQTFKSGKADPNVWTARSGWTAFSIPKGMKARVYDGGKVIAEIPFKYEREGKTGAVYTAATETQYPVYVWVNVTCGYHETKTWTVGIKFTQRQADTGEQLDLPEVGA